MSKLYKMLAIALFGVASLTSNSFADSSAFGGPYIGVQASIAGVELEGNYTDGKQNLNPRNDGQVGMVGYFGSLVAGFNLPLGDRGMLGIGGAYTPTGDANFMAKEVAGGKKVEMSLSDLIEVFIEPAVMISDDSAVFIKAGYSEAAIHASGDDVQDQTNDLQGFTASAGLKTVTSMGIFIKAEMGLTTYDRFRIENITDEEGTKTATAAADAEIAFGALTIGKQF